MEIIRKISKNRKAQKSSQKIPSITPTNNFQVYQIKRRHLMENKVQIALFILFYNFYKKMSNLEKRSTNKKAKKMRKVFMIYWRNSRFFFVWKITDFSRKIYFGGFEFFWRNGSFPMRKIHTKMKKCLSGPPKIDNVNHN
jgi:hypothetical protein